MVGVIKMNRRERREQERKIDKSFGIPKSQKIETKNTFGCEVSNDYIPKNQMELLRKIGLQNIIKVKRRKNGMTSSMKPKGCHSNVRILVEQFGGKQLVGYGICEEGKRPFRIYYHSVWITPEGNAVCITDVDLGNEYLFLPIGLGLISLKPISISPLEVSMGEDWEQGCQIFDTDEGYEESKNIKNLYNLQRIKELVRDNGGLFQKTPPDKIYFSEEIYLQKTDFKDTLYKGTK